jgi:aminomethyltransferase
VAFVEKMVVGDIGGLAPGFGCLSLVTNENGGIIDDTVITNAGDFIYMVVNGATKHGDMAHFQKHLNEFKGDVTMEYLEDSMQLLAIQGPGAAAAVAKLLPSDFDLAKMPFMTGKATKLDGIDNCRITRYDDLFSLALLVHLHSNKGLFQPILAILISFIFPLLLPLRRPPVTVSCGYTGEDGFELAMPAEYAELIAQKLTSDPTVNPTGLGARDSLRLEAGLCLYGNDLNETITPIEGALGWTMGGPGSRRRVEGGFLGADKILTPDGKFKKTSKKRVGIMGMKIPARDHAEIYDATGENLIGEVTSGTFSPCLKAPIAMGYVSNEHSKNGTEIQVKVRGKMQPASVTKMPFVESRYYRVPE